ncbi:reverse transcriptase-like protein [Clostridium aminobutyricum]|uniref:Reverse transcriptase-like protein n=1 Tax=Clostridium aminobutyricum TaxID=33953 RepID=A0A939D903_CLOAM|nr:reverse transcriptase-like protein [Clostridium aminobutyricum]MBN7773300.1 reverse transcriptase-like protein [Clostridium aminobutyricum]
MIKAYLAGISSLYEGEDIEVRYSIYEDQELISKESLIMEYKKPAIVGEVALLTLLKKLEKFKGKEIAVTVNDAALCELIRGTSTTKNKDVQDMVKKVQKELSKFENVVIKNVSVNHIELAKWNEVLQG